MKIRLFPVGVFFVLITVCLTACVGGGQVPSSSELHHTSAQNESQAPSSSRDTTAELANGVCIAEVFSYVGPYVEDGSNEPCEGICAVRLYNPTSVHYQYLRFSLETGGGTATFTATTLFSGAEMIVLSEERLPFSGPAAGGAVILEEIPFETPPSVHLDELSITYGDGYINVGNLTGGAISDVYVYYKQIKDGCYLGGITYRTRFASIAAGETAQTGAQNVRKDGSIVVFSTYTSG